MLSDGHGPEESGLVCFSFILFKAELRTVVIHNVIYYHLSYTANYNTFRSAVYPTCSDIYNVIFRRICF
jgi:hypothetical protein